MAKFWINTGTTGQTWRATFKNGSNELWNGAAFEGYDATNWTDGDYFTSMTDANSIGKYSCAVPAGVIATADCYAEAYSGSAPAATDVPAYQSSLLAADVAAVKTDTGSTVTKLSGITLLKNWLATVMGKTADTATRAEINATTAGAGYNETTDSLEAIRDRGDAAWTSASGSGAFAITVTVSNGTTVVQNATVSLTPPGGPVYSATTNSSGVASFSLNAAVYTRAIVHPLHSFTPDSITVTLAANFNATITPIVITAATDPARTTGYATCYGVDGVIAENVLLMVQLKTSAHQTAGLAHYGNEIRAYSNALGLVEIPGMLREATYRARRGENGQWTQDFVTANASTTPLPETIGPE